MMDDTVEYYNRNADAFFDSTIHADMSEQIRVFLEFLPAGGTVLDAGCGSGRDSLVFMEHGFHVEAFDASEEMCKRAAKVLGKEVLQCRFEDMAFQEQFDGIWACASLVHVKTEDLPEVIRRIYGALKDGGILYASFKKGEGEKYRGERRFTDANEAVLQALLSPYFDILMMRDSEDVRPDRAGETWINVIAGKRWETEEIRK